MYMFLVLETCTGIYMKKVSIIIPVYNVESYLVQCMESVIQQNFIDYEIICVDDASTDSSGNILDAYKEQYDVIQVIRHTKNRGLSAARNTGLEQATGKYVWFVDSDDMICSNSLVALYNMAENYETDMICFELSYDEKDREVGTLGTSYNKNEKIYAGKELFCICVYNKTWRESSCIKFIKRSFLIENQIKFCEGLLHEDVLFSFFCIMQAKRVININNVYYICHKRATSITAQKSHKSAESNFVIMLRLIKYWYTHNFTREENYALKAYVLIRYRAYQYYDKFGQNSQHLEVGNYVEKALYDILFNKDSEQKVTLDKMQIEHISGQRNVIVYGAAYYAADVIDILKENKIEVDMIAVSSMDFNPRIFCDIPVDTIENISKYLKDDVVIVLGVSLKNSMVVKHQLEAMGYRDIVVPEYKG